MKKIQLLFSILFIQTALTAQVSRDAAVELIAVTDSASHSITLQWWPDSNCNSYYIYKMNASGGFTKIKTLKKTDTAYKDTNIVVGKAYEYEVVKYTGGVNGVGFINAGIQIPSVGYRGRMVLICEKQMAASLSNEVADLQADLVADGWFVHRIDVPSNGKVDSIKALLDDIWTIYSADLKAIYLLGHVPIPYSGNINPDGHPDHLGAWPADGYYADMDQAWLDYSVNNSNASRAENRNVPKDGKFDLSAFPGLVELQVGRVYLGDFTVFSETETELMQKYLAKAHTFKMGNTKPEMYAVIDDNFGYFGGEAFAGNAWRNFAPLIGMNNYANGKYFESMKTHPYLWSYGTGGGWYQGASGVGNQDSFKYDSILGTFSMLFGSYFGDWDVQNSFLRGPLASPYSSILTNVWAGRPWWQFHHMALGNNIGFSANLAMNNTGTYSNGYSYGNGFVHISLMGDPSLRMQYVQPPSQLTVKASTNGQQAVLSWKVSPDNRVMGYHIYRADSLLGMYKQITKSPVIGATYSDMTPKNGNNAYMVRAVLLEETPSGSYYNQSLGISGEVKLNTGISQVKNNIEMSVYPNPAKDMLYIQTPNNTNTFNLSVFDLQGKELVRKNIKGNLNTIDLQSFSKGVYMLQLYNTEILKTVKFVIE